MLTVWGYKRLGCEVGKAEKKSENWILQRFFYNKVLLNLYHEIETF